MARLRYLIVAVLVALGACGGGSDEGRLLNGTMTLKPSGGGLITEYRHQITAKQTDIDCSRGLPDTGYSDVRSGAQVVVANEKGTTIARTGLGEGTLVLTGGIRCEFPFSVKVPKAKFYKVEVSHRGTVEKSYDELQSDGWKVELELG